MKTKLQMLFKASICLFAFCLFSFNTIVAQTPVQIQLGTLYTNLTQGAPSTVRYQLTIPYPGQFTIHLTNWLSTLDWGDDID